MRQHPQSFLVSSYNDEDMTELRTHIIDYFLAQQDHYDLFIPYDAGEAHARVRANANIVKMGSHENGMFYRIRIPDFIFSQLGLHPYVLAPDLPSWDQTVLPES